MVRPIILLAEDREDDAYLIQKALSAADVAYPVIWVKDGEEAIAYLKGDEPYAERDKFPHPALLLLDLKMPRKDGFEVLQWIREEPSLRGLRVIVLTSSNQIKDVTKAYALGASSFMVKPLDFIDYRQLGEFINHYWLGVDSASGLLSSEQPKNKIIRLGE